jgi:Tfp pilus assembly protein FimT
MRRPGTCSDTGATLIELLFALGLFLVLSAMAVPQVLAGLDRARARAAARFVAARLAFARAEAVARAATVALRFSPILDGSTFFLYVDGNGNGVRSAEIDSGRDTVLDGPVSLSRVFPGVSIESVSFGTSGIVSFTPVGTATAGTIYLRGREGVRYAVRVFGTTGRTRVLRYDPVTRTFVETL